jgi:hypothetical protein
MDSVLASEKSLREQLAEGTLKYELGLFGAALFGLGVFIAMSGADAAPAPLAATDKFSRSDFMAFDRDFEISGEPCAIGFKTERLCFGRSPFEDALVPGTTLPPEVPLLAAEFRVIVETDLKAEHLNTVRFGQTLVLIDPKTRRIEDMLRLNAPDFESARQPASPGA